MANGIDRARNVTNQDLVCEDCALVGLVCSGQPPQVIDSEEPHMAGKSLKSASQPDESAILTTQTEPQRRLRRNTISRQHSVAGT